jgi:hypothetical protein
MNVFPPAGRLGEAVGKLARRVPEQIIAADLKRLKQLLETGEITRSDASIHEGMHPARPDGDRGPRAAWSPGNGPRAAATGGPET